MAENPIFNRPLDDWEWSVRTRGVFANAGLVTVGDLCRVTEARLLCEPNFGQKSLLEVKEWLVERQLRLGMDLPVARVARVTGDKRLAPICLAKVKVSSVNTRTRQFREWKTNHRGVAIDRCADIALWRVDGEPLCAAHAGRKALEILEGQK